MTQKELVGKIRKERHAALREYKARKEHTSVALALGQIIAYNYVLKIMGETVNVAKNHPQE